MAKAKAATLINRIIGFSYVQFKKSSCLVSLPAILIQINTGNRYSLRHCGCFENEEGRWLRRAPAAVVYRYSPDRKGEHPRAHLAKFRGFLQADGYSGF